jgi:hypothetical protein
MTPKDKQIARIESLVKVEPVEGFRFGTDNIPFQWWFSDRPPSQEDKHLAVSAKVIEELLIKQYGAEPRYYRPDKLPSCDHEAFVHHNNRQYFLGKGAVITWSGNEEIPILTEQEPGYTSLQTLVFMHPFVEATALYQTHANRSLSSPRTEEPPWSILFDAGRLTIGYYQPIDTLEVVSGRLGTHNVADIFRDITKRFS